MQQVTGFDMYEQGYKDGEKSGYQDWIMALMEEFELNGEAIVGPKDFIAALYQHYNVTRKGQ